MSDMPVRITFPANEYRVQSPWLYLQSAGSTGADGSTFGAHVRWTFARNLGDSHLAKGDAATTRNNFNRRDDYVTLYRSHYSRRFPSVLDFRQPPLAVHDSDFLWTYRDDNTHTVMLVHFRDADQYNRVRAGVNPRTDPLGFVRQYSPSVLEIEVPDKLFFAADIDVDRGPATVMRAEAVSVEANEPLAGLFVSCRRRFTNANWCAPDRWQRRRPSASPSPSRSAGPADTPVRRFDFSTPCAGPNLLNNGSFEELLDAPGSEFSTDYQIQQGLGTGIINVVKDASEVNGAWVGLPHSGNAFLTVDGFPNLNRAVLQFRKEVRTTTVYCLAGWLATLWHGDVSIPLEFTFEAAGRVEKFQRNTPATAGVWESFQFFWESQNTTYVFVTITSLSTRSTGNDFGIDDLTFCETAGRDCVARLRSENIRSIRLAVDDGYPRGVQLETYEDYIQGSQWEALDRLALTTDDNTAFARLEPAAVTIDGHWPKFNDQARVNVDNYKSRWSRSGGLKEGLQSYISLSDTDPKATRSLPGANPEDGSITVSVFDALQLVALDFHVARMFGLGYLDPRFEGERDEYVYLAQYETEGVLDDRPAARRVTHYYMGVPTCPLDEREPDRPRLLDVTYGLATNNGEAQPALLTDAAGYTPDGVSRYVNVFVAPDPDVLAPLGPFFVPPNEFCAVDQTSSVFYGVEYRGLDDTGWRMPEIAHDLNYRDSSGEYETLPLPNNADATRPVLRHEERENGIHLYGAYGINWFSRASEVGNVVLTDTTNIRKAARLLPPANFAVQLIQPESPPMLTTAAEQAMLAGVVSTERLVRVTFDYYHVHDINYAFADVIDLFFRTEMPRNVAGALKSVTNDPTDPRKAVIRTKAYTVNSQGTVITPALAPALFPNFIGGVLTCQQESYIVENIAPSSVAGEGPVFTIRKNVKGTASDPTGSGAYVTVNEYIAPRLVQTADVLFMAVENMADAASWGATNPLATTVSILPGFAPHYEAGQPLRGLNETAAVTLVPPGQYRIQFTSPLPHHPQHAGGDRVDWYKGIVRIPRAADPAGPKKVLDVHVIEHLGDGLPLVVHAVDDEPGDPVQTGNVTVNYYPGYRLYLHLDAAAIDPAAGEGMRKTWLGARSRDTQELYASPVGIPAAIVAVELVAPEKPRKPHGPDYATRPDVYYKSSYTFTIDFTHKPFAMAMYRSNDDAILRALYNDTTYAAVRSKLDLLGDDDPHRADRWSDLLGFDYPNGTFSDFDGYAFPNPDKGALNGLPPATTIAALRDAVWGAFTALTEQPLIYDFIKAPSYVPVPKKPTIRDAQGALLSPTDADFDPAPMAKKTGKGYEVQFTDFTLDGTSTNIFFYLVREIGNRGRLGDPSAIAGPVLLINSRPPDAPAVKRMYVEPQTDFGTGPAVHFEVNAYPAVQRVRRMQIYRTDDAASAMSVRTMDLVKTVDLDDQLDKLSVFLSDDFEDGNVPFGDQLFYRLVASRRIKTPTGSDWAPSQPSKLLLTTVLDAINPEPPELTYTSDGLSGAPAVLTNVALSWPTGVHNGTYYLDVMTPAGTWRTIHTVPSNGVVNVNLATTELHTGTLPKADDSGRTLYTRFRVRVMNSSGLFNLTDRVLTI
jgi:hypothetical protein